MLQPTIKIIKPDVDKKEYHAFLLKNKIKVIVVIDKESKLSAACLNVNSGSGENPPELPGLAHFCEHMLFMGTEKYPDESYFSKFITDNGGIYNAGTGIQKTSYMYTIKNQAFIQSLEIFSEFFKSPLFLESSVDRELNAVDSEHQKNLKIDEKRMFRLVNMILGEGTTIERFTTGNLETLRDNPAMNQINVIEKLKEFHRNHYSSNLMTLTLLTNEMSQELVNALAENFQAIPNKDVEHKDLEITSFLSKTGRYVYLDSVKNQNILKIIWPMKGFTNMYKTKPYSYATWLLGHEGEGSLDSLLKAKQWITDFVSGINSVARGIDNMFLKLHLTDQGMLNIEEIIENIYQYIHMMNTIPIDDRILNEIKLNHELSFRFKEEENPFMMVSKISEHLSYMDFEDALSGSHLIKDFDKNLMKELMTYLKPENMLVVISSQSMGERCTKEEYFYKIKYDTEPFSPSFLRVLNTVGLNDLLHLPKVNEYFPESLDLMDYDHEYNDKYNPEVERILQSEGSHRFQHSIPHLIEKSHNLGIWLAQDKEFKSPHVFSYIYLNIPRVYETTMNFIYTHFYIELYKMEINKEAYDLKCAHFSISPKLIDSGIIIPIKGFHDKFTKNMDKFLKIFLNGEFPVDETRFKFTQEKMTKLYENKLKQKPYSLCLENFRYTFTEKQIKLNDIIEKLPSVTMETMREFSRVIFQRIHIDVAFFGNITRKQVLEYYRNQFCQTIQPYRMDLDLDTDIPLKRNFDLSQVEEMPCYQRTFGNVHTDSAIVYYIQCGKRSQENSTKVIILKQLIANEFMEDIRTKQQLCYICAAQYNLLKDYVGLLLIVQSSRSPEFLKERIEQFLTDFLKNLEEMSEEQFQSLKSSLYEKLIQPSENLHSLSQEQFQDIVNRSYIFTRQNIIVNYLGKITKTDMIEFYRDTIYDTSKRKSFIFMNTSTIPNETNNVEPTEYSTNSTIINDFDQFQRTHLTKTNTKINEKLFIKDILHV